eukprot:Selendium_serpulae@DN9463_c0_g1_i1.p1
MYNHLDKNFSQPTAEQWLASVSYVMATTYSVLGTRHWLYAGVHYLLSRFYVGVWYESKRLRESGLMKADAETLRRRKEVEAGVAKIAFDHAEEFFGAVESFCPDAVIIDVCPWAATMMRMALRLGNATKFLSLADKYLPMLQLLYGSWNTRVPAFRAAVQHLAEQPRGAAPDVALLADFADRSLGS